MVDYKLRKKLAQDGYLFDGSRFIFNDNPIAINEYLKTDLWKLPKRLKLA